MGNRYSETLYECVCVCVCVSCSRKPIYYIRLLFRAFLESTSSPSTLRALPVTAPPPVSVAGSLSISALAAAQHQQQQQQRGSAAGGRPAPTTTVDLAHFRSAPQSSSSSQQAADLARYYSHHPHAAVRDAAAYQRQVRTASSLLHFVGFSPIWTILFYEMYFKGFLFLLNYLLNYAAAEG